MIPKQELIEEIENYRFAETYLIMCGDLMNSGKRKKYSKSFFEAVNSIFIKTIPGLICKISCENCIGCLSNMERPHMDCEKTEWEFLVNRHFNEALVNLRERKFIYKFFQDFFNCEYFIEDLRQKVLAMDI